MVIHIDDWFCLIIIGFELKGKLPEGATATDLVLTITKMLREKNVVEKIVEFYGDGMVELSLADRATIANMAPDYGATASFFPSDEKTLEYLRFTGRDEETVQLFETYCKTQRLWHEPGTDEPIFTDTLSLDLATVKPSIAGPKNPEQLV